METIILKFVMNQLIFFNNLKLITHLTIVGCSFPPPLGYKHTTLTNPLPTLEQEGSMLCQQIP
jgi:hypothetical protein